jgi:hypothetical protein
VAGATLSEVGVDGAANQESKSTSSSSDICSAALTFFLTARNKDRESRALAVRNRWVPLVQSVTCGGPLARLAGP